MVVNDRKLDEMQKMILKVHFSFSVSLFVTCEKWTLASPRQVNRFFFVNS
jgi:hypothetical protein